MKVKKYIKRIAALGAGASMLGATVLGAVAADLSDYPAGFVDSGKFNALIVVGESAATQDVLGAIDIATSLQFASKSTKKVAGTTTVDIQGDAWKVGTSSKQLEMSELLDSGTNQESFNNITSFIDENHLGALADGVFSNGQGDYDYEQFLYWDSGTSMYVVYTEDDNDVTADFLYYKSGEPVGRYELDFKTQAESDVTDSAGTLSTTGAYLWDYEGEDLSFLGTDYSIVTARRTTSSKVTSAKLTLMGGAVRDILDEGTSKTYTISGVDYDVTVDFVGSNSAKFSVNGQITDSLLEGSTDKLKDGTQVGVRDVLAQEFAGGTRRVEFFLGAQKVVLWDTDVSDTASSKVLEVGDEKIDDAAVTITGSDDNTTFKIDTISINISADDDLYVPAGGKISDVMVEPQALLSSWDVEYHGFTEPQTEWIKIKTSGSDQYELEFADWGGNQVTVPFAYANSSTTIKFGDDDDDLIIRENMSITKNDYFIVSDESKDVGERPTYALRYKGADKSSRDNPVVKFDLLTGSGSERIEESLTDDSATGFRKATLRLGGATFVVNNVTSTASDDFDLYVDLDADGSTRGADIDFINITTRGGAEIDLVYLANTSTFGGGGSAMGNFNVSITTPDTDDYDNLAPTEVKFSVGAAASEVTLSEISNHNFKKPDEFDNTQFAYTTMGAFMKWENPTGDPGTLDIEYPLEQRLPLVFVTSGATESASGETGGVESTVVNRIEVGAAVLDTDPAVDGKETANNLIVVGGPAINQAAARLMGLPFPSFGAASTVPENAAVVKLIEHANGNMALIVAGWRAEDSQRAARVVADFETYQDAGTLSGEEVQVTGTSLTDITVGAVVMEEVEEEGEAMEEEAAAEEATE